MIADVVDIARGGVIPAFGRATAQLEPYVRAEIQSHTGGYYIRMLVYDRPGALASIATRMAEQGISLESIVQRRRAPRSEAPTTAVPVDPQPLVMITYATREIEIRKALQSIEQDGHIASTPKLIRIEDL